MRGLSLVAVAVLLAAGPAFAQPDPEAGKVAFAAQCRTCHNGAIGPSLRGLVGRAIAGDAAFADYSPALQAKAPEVWTEAALDAFLRSPAGAIPGVRMDTSFPDDALRGDIIAYLKGLKPAE